EDVEDATESLVADRNGDRTAEVERFHAAHHAVGRLHGDAAHMSFANVAGHFGDNVDLHLAELAVVGDAHGVVDRRQMAFFECDVDGGADDLNYLAYFFCHVLSGFVVLRSLFVDERPTMNAALILALPHHSRFQ